MVKPVSSAPAAMPRPPRKPEVTLPVADVPAAEVLDVIEQVHGWSVHWLWARKGASALSHLVDYRKLSPDLVREEGVGYIPGSKDGRTQVRTAARATIPMETLVAAGVATRNAWYIRRAYERSVGRPADCSDALTEWFVEHLVGEPEAYADAPIFQIDEGVWRRNDHLVLPYRIRDGEGRLRVASWKARTLAPGARQRYNKLPDTAVFTQADHLLGYAGSESALDQWGEAVLVEGEIDRLAVMQAFRDDVGDAHPPVLLMGTTRITGAGAFRSGVEEDACLEELAGPYAPLVGRWVVQFIDEDGPGRRAVSKNASALAALGCRVHIGRPSHAADGVGEVKDVSDLLRLHGARAVRRAFAAAHGHDMIDIEIELWEEAERALPEEARTLKRKIDRAREMAELIGTLPPALRASACSRVADSLQLEPGALEREVARQGAGAAVSSPSRGRAG